MDSVFDGFCYRRIYGQLLGRRRYHPGLVGAIVIMRLFVGETRGLDLKTVTGTEWDKPKKVKEEQQDGE